MNKLIYLFELDSMCNTKEEVRQAQEIMFYEIVENGNQIVLTYNQIVDSHGFLIMLLEEETYQFMIDFIKKGYIKFSQYKVGANVIGSPIQYMLQSLSKPDFVFTALPLLSGQGQNLNQVLLNALANVDVLSLEKHPNLRDENRDFLKKFVTMLTLLSLETSAVNPPKIHSGTDSPQFGLFEIFELIYNFFCEEEKPCLKDDGRNLILSNAKYLRDTKQKRKLFGFQKNANGLFVDSLEEELLVFLPVALKLIFEEKNRESEYVKNVHNRSQWKSFFDSVKYEETNLHHKDETLIKSLGECLIDLCYNYGVESSINGVSTHYKWNPEYGAIQYSLISDFVYRLLLYWNKFKLGHHRFLEDDKDDLFGYENHLLAPWNDGNELVPDCPKQIYTGKSYAPNKVELKKAQKSWKKLINKTYNQNCFSTLTIVTLFFLFEYITSEIINPFIKDKFYLLGEYLDMKYNIAYLFDNINLNAIFISFLEKLFFIVIFSMFAAVSGKMLKRQDILDTIQLFFKKTKSYYVIRHKKDEFIYSITLEENERYEIMIKDSIEQYFQLIEERPQLFEGDSLKIIKDEKQIRKYQDELEQPFGVVYQSKYHIMVVDLVQDSSGRIFPYERIIPFSTHPGVVMVPLYQGKFVLLEQFRHAIREKQLCLPRGFGEDDVDITMNAHKELKEELGADWINLKFLGKITGDSGLSSSKAYVYTGEITCPQELVGEEGIERIHCLTTDELKRCIANNEIQDSLTISALNILWQKKDD